MKSSTTSILLLQAALTSILLPSTCAFLVTRQVSWSTRSDIPAMMTSKVPMWTSSTTEPSSSSSAAATIAMETTTSPTGTSVPRNFETFRWNHQNNTYKINYRVEGPVNAPPILLVHGFGANVGHYRHQFAALQDQFRVYAIDMIGFGASDKPSEVHYSLETSVELLRDFLEEMDRNSNNANRQWVVAGNSIGGLCSLGLAKELPEQIRGVVLFNCAGGMSGFRYSDVPLLVRPILWFLQNVLLGPQLGARFFANFKSRENVEAILRTQGVYRDQTNVDDALLEMLLRPADDDGAETVFLKTFAGPPGPTPESILPDLSCPVLAIWGGDDPWTPVDAGMHPGTGFSSYAKEGKFELVVLPGVGHCPHDEAPDQVHAAMIPWMQRLPAHTTKS